MVNGILWKIRTGADWRDVPELSRALTAQAEAKGALDTLFLGLRDSGAA